MFTDALLGSATPNRDNQRKSIPFHGYYGVTLTMGLQSWKKLLHFRRSSSKWNSHHKYKYESKQIWFTGTEDNDFVETDRSLDDRLNKSSNTKTKPCNQRKDKDDKCPNALRYWLKMKYESYLFWKTQIILDVGINSTWTFRTNHDFIYIYITRSYKFNHYYLHYKISPDDSNGRNRLN
jgi:hypothetical protein